EERTAMHRPAEWLYAQAITRGKHTLFATVPQNKGEHTVQVTDDIGSPTPVTFENNLRVRLRPENRSVTSKHLAQLNKIINFAVEHDDVTTIESLHRLIACCEIDY